MAPVAVAWVQVDREGAGSTRRNGVSGKLIGGLWNRRVLIGCAPAVEARLDRHQAGVSTITGMTRPPVFWAYSANVGMRSACVL